MRFFAVSVCKDQDKTRATFPQGFATKLATLQANLSTIEKRIDLSLKGINHLTAPERQFAALDGRMTGCAELSLARTSGATLAQRTISITALGLTRRVAGRTWPADFAIRAKERNISTRRILGCLYVNALKEIITRELCLVSLMSLTAQVSSGCWTQGCPPHPLP